LLLCGRNRFMAVFYNYIKYSSFVANDASLIIKKHPLLTFAFDPTSKVMTPLVWIKQIFYLIIYANKYNVIYSHSAGYHTFIPSLLSALNLKKHIIILHGSESNVLPSISYGNLLKPILGWFTRFSINNATELVPVSEAILQSKSEYLSPSVEMGLMANMPHLKTPATIIYNGIDTSQFQIEHSIRNPYSFITVASGIHDQKTKKLKGIDLILDIAKLFPFYHFTIVGSETIFGYGNDLLNVKLIKNVPNEKLGQLYNQNAYYLQLSLIEGFGVALCEAMACGCVPIVSNVGILPTIATENGYVLDKKELNLLSILIKSLPNKYDLAKGDILRQSIIDRYQNEIRFNGLLKILNKYVY